MITTVTPKDTTPDEKFCIELRTRMSDSAASLYDNNIRITLFDDGSLLFDDVNDKNGDTLIKLYPQQVKILKDLLNDQQNKA